ncbi:hypothetical protein PVAP13_8KG383700 [Panicum virgatum]|uniref:Uncharacterized protein n=1 Tax=Panicum virgatum TaxID=38727 RepID=A0A8T0Q1C2_PANVG|nr:hypothetical protein PVAP13_8KG383700 [Panicum virgatum]
MGSRYEVEVTMGSARDLKNVNWRHDSGVRCSTRIDLDGGENSTRDEKILILLPPASRLEDAVYASHTAPQRPRRVRPQREGRAKPRRMPQHPRHRQGAGQVLRPLRPGVGRYYGGSCSDGSLNLK